MPMEKTDKPISTAYIHSVYSGKDTVFVTDDKQDFHSTSQFDRDPSHSGSAPEDPKSAGKPYRR
jgi:hypothetical protein